MKNETSKFSYKYAGIAALLIFIVAMILPYCVSQEYSMGTNSLILSDIALDDFEQAKQVIENAYKIRENRPILYLYWNMYVESCKAGNCMELMFDVDLRKPNEITAYEVVKRFTKDKLKSPTTASFEEKTNLAENAVIGKQYSFSYTVDSQNSYGAMLRLNCIASVQNAGEASWFLGTLDCN